MHQSKRQSVLLSAVGILSLTAISGAQTFTETTDAGSTVATASTTGSSSGTLTAIRGTVSNASDADIFKINITGASTFSATTVNAVTNGSGIDSKLFLFDLSGHAIAANDDDQSGTSVASRLPAGNTLYASLTAGVYLLAITGSGYEPTNGPPPNQLLFNQPSDTTTVAGPASGLNPTTLGGFTQGDFYSASNFGAYEIDLTSTSAVPAAVTTGNGSWITNGNGSWLTSTNWSPALPNAIDNIATFGTNGGLITASPTVTVDGPVTVGTINFDNAHSYTLSGTSAITMDVSSGSAALNVISGSHTISAPLVLNDNTNFNVVSATSTLTASAVSATNKTITKSGSGTLAINRLRDVTLAANGGVTKFLPAASDGTTRVLSLTIASGAKVDTGSNPLVIDYTGAVGTQVTDTRSELNDGRLSSSSASTAAHTRLGYGDTAVLGAGTYGGLSVDNTTVAIKLTYDGDANLDGKVDVADLGRLATGYGKAGVWTDGDFNYDGTVNIADLGLLATTYGFGATSPLALSFDQALSAVGLPQVPEPAAASLMLGATLVLRRRGHAVS